MNRIDDRLAEGLKTPLFYAGLNKERFSSNRPHREILNAELRHNLTQFATNVASEDGLFPDEPLGRREYSNHRRNPMCGDCSEGSALGFVGPSVDAHLSELAKALPHKDATFTERSLKMSQVGWDLKHAWQEAEDFFSRISNEQEFLVRGFREYRKYHEERARREMGETVGNLFYRVFPEFAEVAFCRLFEQRLLHGFFPSQFAAIEELLGQGTVSGFLDFLRKTGAGTVWKALGCWETYTSQIGWDGFIHAITEDLRHAETQVAMYIEKCTTGPGGGFPDEVLVPTPKVGHRLDVGGVRLFANRAGVNPSSPAFDFPSLYSMRTGEGEYLSEHFSASFLAMLILERKAPRHELLTTLALARPGVCDFGGNAYWIARRAFFHCVKTQGVDFILDNYENVRLLLIAYVVLKASMSKPDLKQLQRLIQEREPELVWQIDQAQLVQLIDQRIGHSS